MAIFKNKKFRLTYTQLIILSFLAVIFIGGFLLTLPISSTNGEWTPFFTSLFTSTSATCVTGLVVVDTFSQWSLFGQIVILIMIQIGGLGLMTLISSFSLFFNKNISLRKRSVAMQTVGAITYNSVSKLLVRILIGTLIFEGAGIILLSIRFVPQFGFGRGLWFSIFHSVSAFCNAGFDLMGCATPFGSLTDYATDPLVSLTICGLIIVGGIGFLVWDDFYQNGFKLKKYKLHTKLALLVSFSLLIVGWVSFLGLEYNNTLKDYSTGEKLVSSFFQSVTTRTAGFDSLGQDRLTGGSKILTIVLMFVGGTTGSTAGGIKTTTFAVLIVSFISSMRGRNSVVVFKRKISDSIVKKAAAIVTVYLLSAVTAATAIAGLDGISAIDAFYETVSAIGTVGLTTGITTSLCTASQIILILLMFAGRVGGLSLMLAFAESRTQGTERPAESILIG